MVFTKSLKLVLVAALVALVFGLNILDFELRLREVVKCRLNLLEDGLALGYNILQLLCCFSVLSFQALKTVGLEK